uniref:Ribonuclease VapC n=1 Tax=Acidobacterium capsulatum TaxID=33075 RepID=A0A7V5CSM2_9BACT
MIIVDTSVWIDYLGGAANPHTEWLDRNLDAVRLGLTDLILCEILQGIRSEAVFERVRHQMSVFEIHSMAGEELAVQAASNYRYLRARGRTVRTTIDCLIATFCVHHGHSLLHKDRDFAAFEKLLGLKVIHP